MATLKFKGPFHWDHLFIKTKENPKPKSICGKEKSLLPPNKPGIYIWGFVMKYDSAKKELVDFVEFKDKNNFKEYTCKGNKPIGVNLPENWKFIPYYVGLDAKLLSRVFTHHDVTNGDSSKYSRMHKEYYKSFFKHIPINIGNDFSKVVKNFVANNKTQNTYSYFNNIDVLEEIYGKNMVRNNSSKSKSNQNPIRSIVKLDKGNWVQIIDTLEDIIEKNNNFWFCYAELDDTTKANFTFNNLTDLEYYKLVNKNFLEYPEAQTFYSLKGITISHTLKHGTPNPFGVNFKIDAEPTCKGIFKQDLLGNITDSTNFPGY